MKVWNCVSVSLFADNRPVIQLGGEERNNMEMPFPTCVIVLKSTEEKLDDQLLPP